MQYLRCVHFSVLYFKGDIYLIIKWLVCIIRDLENQPKSQKYGNLKKLESLKEFFFYFHPLDLEFRLRVVLFRYGQIWVTRSMENWCRYHMSGSQQDTTMLFANTQYTNLKHEFETLSNNSLRQEERLISQTMLDTDLQPGSGESLSNSHFHQSLEIHWLLISEDQEPGMASESPWNK